MPKGAPKIAEEATEQARRVHSFALSRGLSLRNWALRAGISPNTLTELFSGRTKSLTYANLLKLARAESCYPTDIVGEAGILDLRGELLVSLSAVHKAVATWAVAHAFTNPEAVATEIVAVLEDVHLQGMNSA